MLSPVLKNGLKAYAIGPKVRHLRLRKRIGLVELGRHTGLSPALLSKIERGLLFPPLPTLLRIAMVFSVGLDYFFTDERKRHVVAVVRRKERKRFPERTKTGQAAYHFESLDFAAQERRFNSYLAEFHPVAEGRAAVHSHDGVEFVHLLSGRLTLRIGEDDHTLEKGDSIYFDATVPHSYRRAGRSECHGLVVTSP